MARPSEILLAWPVSCWNNIIPTIIENQLLLSNYFHLSHWWGVINIVDGRKDGFELILLLKNLKWNTVELRKNKKVRDWQFSIGRKIWIFIRLLSCSKVLVDSLIFPKEDPKRNSTKFNTFCYCLSQLCSVCIRG